MAAFGQQWKVALTWLWAGLCAKAEIQTGAIRRELILKKGASRWEFDLADAPSFRSPTVHHDERRPERLISQISDKTGAIAEKAAISAIDSLASPTGFEPVLPP